MQVVWDSIVGVIVDYFQFWMQIFQLLVGVGYDVVFVSY